MKYPQPTMTLGQVRAEYARIRKEHPGEPYGDHWRGWGVQLGKDVWADPKYQGMEGEAEHLVRGWREYQRDLRLNKKFGWWKVGVPPQVRVT